MINPKLRVGQDCRYMNYSAIFEYLNKSELAAAYTYFDTVYEFETFTTFNDDKDPKEHISKDNDLLITGEIKSGYRSLLHDLCNQKVEASNCFKVKYINISTTTLEKLQENYLSKKKPVIIPVDHYYLMEDYRKENVISPSYHSSFHAAVLLNVDFKNNECLLLDKFFKFYGKVSLENFLRAMNSEYLVVKGEVSYIDTFDDNFKVKVNYSILEQVVQTGLKITVGVKGTEKMFDDFARIIESMYEQKGVYAPLYTTNLMQPIRLQKESVANHLESLCNKAELIIPECLIAQIHEVANEWNKLDILCDKAYLSNTHMKKMLDVFNNVLDRIVYLENKVYEELQDLLLI
ncbi:hypothetical protein EAI05_14090 [Bacillus subtilis]|uniref:hypothetical protein n=1 Tax=Bacillus subtilis TaxID=1423 RepID=UPI000F088CAD|nr:hypothetical protein [Bacillus subtilis]QQF64487.1 hypothetical protein I9X38_09615 [Bacillus mojavensis]MBO3637045.1 hypothetical protein [Bacillus subtilis]MCV2517500.1 hypothetical protein [Bacillus subtilis]QHJ99353.1 hypothetical protein C7M17_02456 [Bacillus subtilis]RNA71755.1 hypothetical protein EAI05_14090 [Bacillus subtilis]